MNPIFKALLK